MNLYHYYDKTTGPFRNLSDLPAEQAKQVLETIKTTKPDTQCAKRHDKYIEYRRNCERIIRTEFAKKGGQISRTAPHYMVAEHSPWLYSWYENCRFIMCNVIFPPKASEVHLKKIHFKCWAGGSKLAQRVR